MIKYLNDNIQNNENKSPDNIGNDNKKTYNIDIDFGLSFDQVKERIEKGFSNEEVKPKFKTTKQIFLSNIFTGFNILNFILLACVLFVGSFKNALFIGVVISNILCGIIQEIKVYKVIKKLSIVSQPKVNVIRQGKMIEINVSEVVLDDIIVLNSGNQVVADVVMRQGSLEVDESLITGESDLILKQEGDMLISGSFVISGAAKVQVVKVGVNTYVSKILIDVGEYKHNKNQSQIMRYINTLVKISAFIIGPMSILSFYKEYFLLHNSLAASVIFTVASIIGIIPQGIVLLTTIALMIGVLRLSKLGTLTQDLYCLETLSEVDVLCLDKTGTITKGNLKVDKLINISQDYKISEIKNLLKQFCLATKDNNATIKALKETFIKDHNQNYKSRWKLLNQVYFSSERKWSGVNFKNGTHLILGAPKVIMKERLKDYDLLIQPYLDQGYRILGLGISQDIISEKFFSQENSKNQMILLAFIIISDQIREGAEETLNFLKKQGIKLKIISGDNAKSVSKIAEKVNFDGFNKYIDFSSLNEKEKTNDIIEENNIFGRTTPEQKRDIIRSMKQEGHIVGMIGDGVNDILALKEADCSIAMAQGSDAARQISKFILLDSNFKAIPSILNEGQRVVNNIIRAASMFLIKNIYSLGFSLLLIFFSASYPFEPIQLSLISSVTIAIPSFFLVLENNKGPIKGSFFKKVLNNAIWPAFIVMLNIVFINMVSQYLIVLTPKEISTIAVILTGISNLLALANISRPITRERLLIIMLSFIVLIFSVMLFRDFFSLAPINLKMILLILPLSLVSFLPFLNKISNQ